MDSEAALDFFLTGVIISMLSDNWPQWLKTFVWVAFVAFGLAYGALGIIKSL